MRITSWLRPFLPTVSRDWAAARGLVNVRERCSAGTGALHPRFLIKSITSKRASPDASADARTVDRSLLFGAVMKDFSEATFVPEMVDVMTEALDASVATLPHPVSSTQVNLLAESILRTAQSGERDPAILQRMALLELTITPRD